MEDRSGGRIYKALAEADSSFVKPTYYRIGAGLKMGYEGKNIKGGMALFYAKDSKNTIPIPRKYENADVRPMENIALAFTGSLPIAKVTGLALESEVSTSVLTHDLLKNDQRDTSKNPIAWLLKNRNATTNVYHAVKTALTYTMEKNGSLSLAYERVDPNYRTLGGLFFTNDFENITINAVHQGKVNLGFSTGVQRDDIADKKRKSTGRMVIGYNMTFKPTEKIDVSLNYSNFQSYTFIQTGFERINRLTALDNLDTLHFTQLSQNASMNLSYNIGQTETKTQTISTNINFMESAQARDPNVPTSNATRFINGLVNYNLNWLPKELTVATAVNYAINEAALKRTITVGPTVSVAKSLFDKRLTTNAVVAYNQSWGGVQKSSTTTMSIGAMTVLNKKHNLALNLVHQYRTSAQAKTIVNFTATASYNYSFAWTPKNALK